MIRVVEEACEVRNGKLVMVMESESLAELVDSQIVKMAVTAAQRFGWPNACLNGQDPPQPVDIRGNTPDDYGELCKLANTEGVRYRKHIYLVNRF